MKQRRLIFLSALLLVVTLILAACNTAPAATPAAETGGESTEPTAAPAEGETGGSETTGASGKVTLWHAYGTGSTEETTLTKLIENARAAMPGMEIEVVQLPFDQIFNRYRNEVLAGGGPDMFLAPNDDLGNLSREGVVAPIDALVEGKLDAFSDVAVQGMTVDGQIYGIPESAKAVALYYNKSMVPTPPATQEELLALVEAGNSIALNQSAYHNFPFFTAYGGKLLSDDGTTCTATDGGFVEGLAQLVALKAAGATFETDGGRADTLFRTGEVAMIVNGPWVLGDYKKDLGDNLGVAPVPAGTAPAAALNGIDGFYISPASKNQAGAVELALFLTNAESSAIYTEEAGHVPIRSDVTASDPLVAGFAAASAQGFPRPQTVQFGNWWGPFGDAINQAVEGVAEPEAAITTACEAMNAASAGGQ